MAGHVALDVARAAEISTDGSSPGARGRRAWCHTPCIFIGNNRYRFDLLAPGRRLALDEGRLSVHVARATTCWAVLRLGLKAVLGRLGHDDDWITSELAEFWIECRRRHVAVGLDGEVYHLEAPLHFRVRPRALRVLTPS